MTIENMLRRAGEARAAAPPVGHDAYLMFVKAVRDRMNERWERILDCSARDLNRARDHGLPEPFIQRLRLTDRQKTALECACTSIERDLPRDQTTALIHGDDGIRCRKVLRPLGVILMIFEARAEIALRAAMPRGWEHRDGLDRQCAWCAGPIGPERDRRAVYCGNRCRRAAHYHAHERTGAGGSADVRSIEGDGWETRRPMEAHRHVQS